MPFALNSNNFDTLMRSVLNNHAMKRIFITQVWILLVCLCSAQVRQASEGTTTIFGFASDEYNGFQVQGAWAVIDGTSHSAYTDSWGRYEIPDVPIEPLTADFSADVTAGFSPLQVQFTGTAQGGPPLLKLIHDDYVTWMTDDYDMVTNGMTHVDAVMHPLGKMRISAEWNYYQYMNPVTAYLKTPLIGNQGFEINSVNPTGSLSEPPYAVFTGRDGGEGKILYLTFSDFSQGPYRYYLNVDKFGVGWGYDVPTVKIFNEDSLVYTVTSTVIGPGDWWYVCDINGPGGEVTVINQWLESPPPGLLVKNSQPPFAERIEVPGQASRGLSFHWDFGDGTYSDEQSPVHTYASPGLFTVTMTVSNGSYEVIETKSSYIQVGGPWIPENSVLSVSVTPNPAGEMIEVVWKDPAPGSGGEIYWQILDGRGRAVLGGKCGGNPCKRLQIDVSGLPPGLYVINISNGHGEQGSCKFITLDNLR